MTVRNGERYLAPAIQSILGQDMPDFELVVVDDGSSDTTPAILAEFALHDRRIRVFTLPPSGIPAAANHGLSHCRGEYVARMDADDVALPARLRKQIVYLEEQSLVCCGSYVHYIDARGRYLTTVMPPLDDPDIQHLILRGHGAIYNPSALIRRDALTRIGGYDAAFDTAEDLDCWLRLGEIGRLGNIPEALLQYRLHDKSISETGQARQRERGRLACEHAWTRRGLTGIPYEATDHWRPGRDRHSRHEHMLRYGWWAFNSGERSTAMIYGFKTIGLEPWQPDGWKLLTIAMLKTPRKAG